jgi:hypothetical protein
LRRKRKHLTHLRFDVIIKVPRIGIMEFGMDWSRVTMNIVNPMKDQRNGARAEQPEVD